MTRAEERRKLREVLRNSTNYPREARRNFSVMWKIWRTNDFQAD